MTFIEAYNQNPAWFINHWAKYKTRLLKDCTIQHNTLVFKTKMIAWYWSREFYLEGIIMDESKHPRGVLPKYVRTVHIESSWLSELTN